MLPSATIIPLPTLLNSKAKSGPEGMLADCRQIATTRLSKLITKMLNSVEDEFFALAETATSREDQNLYLDARTQSREQRHVIEAQFKLQFEKMFDRRLSKEQVQATVPDFDHMALVDDDEVSGDVAVSGMVQRLRGACDTEFGMLASRVEHLLGGTDLNEADNPLSPDVMAEALNSALGHLNTSMHTRITLMRALESHLTQGMLDVYQALNAHLATNSVLPDIKPGTWRRKLKPTITSKLKTVAAPGSDPAQPQTGTAGEQNLFEALQRAFQPKGPVAQAGVSVNTGVVPAGVGSQGQPSAVVPPPPTESIVAALANFQRDFQNQADSHTATRGAWAQALKAHPGVLGANSVDTLTIDIVALLFDHIFDDADIQNALKTQFGRLQIPVLKVALLDKTFFSNNQHPTRALLNRMAELAVGVVDSGPVIDFLSEMVTRIQAKYESNPDIFAQSLVELNAFCKNWQAQESRLCATGAMVILDTERKETAKEAAVAVAVGTIAIFVAERPTTDWLIGVLTKYWQPLLGGLAGSNEENSARLVQLMAVAQDLRWSLEPKLGVAEHEHLVKMLPTLVRSVVSILKEAQASSEEVRELLDYLVACHVATIKQYGAEVLVQKLKPGSAILIDEIKPLPALEADIPVIERDKGSTASSHAGIARGTWMEFKIDGNLQRGKLTWVSPKKGIYLFTNPEHLEPVSVSPADLEDWIKQGHARVLDGKPLVERAVARALSTVH